MTSDPKKQRVIIIGAGPAGLTAGYEILKTAGDRFDVQILEASDAIGGISRTVVYNGNRMDIGGHRFFSKDASVMRWWEERLPIQGAPAKDNRRRRVHLARAPRHLLALQRDRKSVV